MSALTGYSALINQYRLKVVPPIPMESGEEERPRDDGLFGHLLFAMEHEPLNLAILKSLFGKITSSQMEVFIEGARKNLQARRLWFFYEYLLSKRLDLLDADQGDYVLALNPELQYPGPERPLKRYRVTNNLPGEKFFCPLLRRTKKLDLWSQKKTLDVAENDQWSSEEAHATYEIEGENSSEVNFDTWKNLLNGAWKKNLFIEELNRIQGIAISTSYSSGLRLKDFFEGTSTPSYIGAAYDDLGKLMNGLIEAINLLKGSVYHPIFISSVASFGLFFIRPYDAGNGIIQRYLWHHLFMRTGFVPKGVVLPLSPVLLKKWSEYEKVLDLYSQPRLPLIEWKSKKLGEIEVLNETVDLYRFFDGTAQTEFLCDCIDDFLS